MKFQIFYNVNVRKKGVVYNNTCLRYYNNKIIYSDYEGCKFEKLCVFIYLITCNEPYNIYCLTRILIFCIYFIGKSDNSGIKRGFQIILK